MSGLHAIRELRVCNDVTAEYLSHPVRVHADRVLDCILPRSMVWLSAVDAFAVSCVCRAWKAVSGDPMVWKIQLLRRDARLATNLCSNDHNHASLHDWRALFRCAVDRQGRWYALNFPSSIPTAPGAILSLRQLCELEACCEEAVFVTSVAREHLAGKPFIPHHIPSSMSPLFELSHWKTVADNLHAFQSQLESEEFSRITTFLEESETNPGLCSIVKTSIIQLKRLHSEAAWNIKYLSILEAPFAKLRRGSLKELNVVVPGLIRTLAMVWSSSKSYNSAVRMEPLVYRCSRAIVARIGWELKPVDLLSWACNHFARSIADSGSHVWPTLSDVALRFPVLHPDALSMDVCTAMSCLPRDVTTASSEAESIVLQGTTEGLELALQILDSWRSSLLTQCGPEAQGKYVRLGTVAAPRRKRLTQPSRRSSGGLSSLGSTANMTGQPGRRPPRHPSTNRLSVSLTSAGSSSSPPPSPSVLLEDMFPAPPVALPDRAALDELRKSLRTPSFRTEPETDGVARKKANDWSTFDAGLHVALIDYTYDRLVDCRNTLAAIRDMATQVRELSKSEALSLSPVGTLDDSFDASPSPVPSEAPAVVRYFCKSLYQLDANLSCFLAKEPGHPADDSSLYVFDAGRKTWWTGALEHFRLRCAKMGFQDADSDDD